MLRSLKNIRFAWLACMLLTVEGLQAQPRNFNWVFSAGVWLQFSPDTMVSVPLADTISHRNACISDTAGQFLLLADDFGIRNALFNTIQGGSTSELGWNTPAGNYLILPMPGHAERYAVFINELPPSTRAGMVQVDMAANGGAGAVVGGTQWYMQNTTAKLTATTHASETGYWVLQHADSGDAFHAFHLGTAGLDTIPVISHAGTAYLPITAPKANMDRRGQMNFNFQGTRLGLIKNGASMDTSVVELFHFDRSSGVLAFWTEIGPEYSWWPGEEVRATPWMRGIDFDHNGGYLYIAHVDTGTFPVLEVIQYDLSAPLDSLSYYSNFVVGWNAADPSYYDNIFGSDIATTPLGYSLPSWPASNGYLFHRIAENPALYDSLFNLQLPHMRNLPFFTATDGYHILHLWNTQFFGGLPAPSKRYHVDDGTGVPERPPAGVAVAGIRPNPMVDHAVLVVNGSYRPEEVRWRDVLGREWRRAAVERLGPSYILDRNGLPAGLYLVEVFDSQGSLGVVKVVCQ